MGISFLNVKVSMKSVSKMSYYLVVFYITSIKRGFKGYAVIPNITQGRLLKVIGFE